MAAYKKTTEGLYQEKFKSGCGQGTGSKYKSFMTTNEVSSSGQKSRIPSEKCGRTVNTLSNGETNIALFLEFEPSVTDYREQFPMERDLTYALSRQLGIRHSRTPDQKSLLVMTTDFVVTLDCSSHIAIDCKPDNYLLNQRTVDKLKIHAAYFRELGIEHFIVTPKNLPQQVIQNIRLLSCAHIGKSILEDATGDATDFLKTNIDEIQERGIRYAIDATQMSCDAKKRILLGLRHLASTSQIHLDLTRHDVFSSRVFAAPQFGLKNLLGSQE